jgi:broad specificity phosphatase PhoE
MELTASGPVFLVRHGRTALNAAGLLRGRLDPPLDEVGYVEAVELAQALSYLRPVRILTSPLRRAVQTARPLGLRAGTRPMIDARLADRDYGSWAGEDEAAVVQRWGSLDDAPGVEAAAAVVERALAVLDEQVPHVDAGPVVLVAHEAVNRLLLASLDTSLGSADGIPQRTGCWNVLNRVDGHWRVEQVDQRGH